jgi:hypothetical protein
LSTIGKHKARCTVDEKSFCVGIAIVIGTYAHRSLLRLNTPLALMKIPVNLRRAPQEVEQSTAPLVWRPTGIQAALRAR